ncbi:hypothetical protein G6F57_019423 [Rhizopus arrhizus]|nr:hypothetical protein G6F57_019423 [Rhizopus arrhizus]
MNRAPHFILVDCPGADRKLAFGLSWQVLIGSDVAGLARARGRRLRATHLVVGGSPATVAGYGRARSSWRRGSPATASRRRHTPHIQAAAQLYALRYPEGGMCLVPLPEGRYWLAAAQDGCVLSQADKVFASHRDALDAHARLREQPGRGARRTAGGAAVPVGRDAACLTSVSDMRGVVGGHTAALEWLVDVDLLAQSGNA